MASQKDIARALGLTQAAVSMALANHPRMSAQTKQRVIDKAEELNYRPNPLLSEAASRRWSAMTRPETVAVITDRPLGNRLVTLMRERCGAMGFSLESFSPDEAKPARMASILEARGIRGVIFVQARNTEFLNAFPWDKFISVSCIIGMAEFPSIVVSGDWGMAANHVFREIRQRGYQKPLIVLPRSPAFVLAEVECEGVFRQLLSDNGIPDDCLVSCQFDNEKQVLSEALGQQEYDVVVTHNSFCRDIVEAEQKRRGAGNLSWVALLVYINDLDVSGCRFGLSQVIAVSVDILAQRLHQHQFGLPETPYAASLPPTWNEGETLPRRAFP